MQVLHFCFTGTARDGISSLANMNAMHTSDFSMFWMVKCRLAFVRNRMGE